MKNNFAIIDIGTNSFHLIIAKVTESNYKILKRKREVFHLRTESQNALHTISQENILAGFLILEKYKKLADKFDAKIYAFATSALREATNKNEFISIVRRNLGFEIKVLTGNEEAELVSVGINFHFDVKNKNVLIFDLGGGSTEFVFQEHSKIVYKNSLKLGAVRQTQKYFSDGNYSVESIKKCKHEIEKLINGIKIDEKKFDLCFGVGGTISSIMWMIEKNIFDIDHHYQLIPNYKITRKNFEIIKKKVYQLAIENKLDELKAIDKQRKRIILAGIFIVESIFDKFSLKEIIASNISIRESFLIKQVFHN